MAHHDNTLRENSSVTNVKKATAPSATTDSETGNTWRLPKVTWRTWLPHTRNEKGFRVIQLVGGRKWSLAIVQLKSPE